MNFFEKFLPKRKPRGASIPSLSFEGVFNSKHITDLDGDEDGWGTPRIVPREFKPAKQAKVHRVRAKVPDNLGDFIL